MQTALDTSSRTGPGDDGWTQGVVDPSWGPGFTDLKDLRPISFGAKFGRGWNCSSEDPMNFFDL